MPDPHGIVLHGPNATRRTDYLYRVSLKCLIRNEQGEVLVVKETGRHWWDLPGGGMDHGESIATAIAREMKEEVNMEGDFTFRILDVDEPALLSPQNFWQLRLVFAVTPERMVFSAGDDGDKIAFMSPSAFKGSEIATEKRIFDYAALAGL
ncbi:MAG TPA: NUDIX hydrolase [Candidatus Saccharimonadales bacterium]|nr:NUDIX hydrolase [Candidatus Saccharimonadales bacterium]